MPIVSEIKQERHETDPNEQEEESGFNFRNIGEIVDLKVDEEQMQIDDMSNKEQETHTLSGNGTMNLEDLQIEEEDERAEKARETKFDEDEYEVASKLFEGFLVVVVGHTANNMDPKYKTTLQKRGAEIRNNLDSSVTHIFFQEK